MGRKRLKESVHDKNRSDLRQRVENHRAGKLEVDDFPKIAPQIDSIISRYGKIRLLIDASRLKGWENIAAFENHAKFVKTHQEKVERIAVIAQHDWQHWLVAAVRVFLHPQIRAYDRVHENEALQWLIA